MKTPRFFKIPAGGPAEVPYRLIYNIFFRFAREKQSGLEKQRQCVHDKRPSTAAGAKLWKISPRIFVEELECALPF